MNLIFVGIPLNTFAGMQKCIKKLSCISAFPHQKTLNHLEPFINPIFNEGSFKIIFSFCDTQTLQQIVLFSVITNQLCVFFHFSRVLFFGNFTLPGGVGHNGTFDETVDEDDAISGLVGDGDDGDILTFGVFADSLGCDDSICTVFVFFLNMSATFCECTAGRFKSFLFTILINTTQQIHTAQKRTY